MLPFFIILVALFAFPGLHATCTVETTDKTLHYDYPIAQEYIDGEYEDIYSKSVIENATVRCFDVNSVAQIDYQYQEEDYEQILVIENSNISAIHPMELMKFSTITKLYLSQLYIKNIYPGAFDGLSRLRELYLDNNELSEISDGVYNTLHHLENFDMSNNNIFRVGNQAFSELSALAHLYLQNNNLTIISDNLFDSLNRISYIDLSENPIEMFPFNKVVTLDVLLLTKTSLNNVSSDMSNVTMKIFDISFCDLTSVDFDYFPKSEEINLSHNKIISVENCDVVESTVVDLGYNFIENINVSFQQVSKLYLNHNKFRFLQKTLLQDCSTLLVLDLSYNYLSKIDKDFFHDLSSLEVLKLQHNEIVSLNPILFQNLSRLVDLDLSENKIKELRFGIFDHLKNLESLNISANQLLDLQHDTFNSLSNLHHLYFDNNQISSIEVNDLMNHLNQLRVISLNHNNWKCKDLVNMNTLLKVKNVFIVNGDSYDTDNFHGIACSNSKKALLTNVSSSFNQENVFNNTLKLRYEEIGQNLQEAINDGIKNSKINNFLNEVFKNSKFVQYFNKNYIESGFFKYLNNLNFLVTRDEILNGTEVEKLTTIQESSNQSDNKMLILIVFILAILLILLICDVYLKFNFIKKQKSIDSETVCSQLELS